MPKRIYSFQYLNQYSNVQSIQTPPIPSQDVLEVSRNGIGVVKTAGGTETINTNVIAYTRQSVGTTTTVADRYIISSIVINSPTTRTFIFELGPVVIVNDIYEFYVGSASASYQVQLGDATTDVRDALTTLSSATNFGVSITWANLESNKIMATVFDTFTTIEYRIVANANLLFQKGYYCDLSSKKYMITKLESFTAYPTLPSISGSYAFSSLTLMPSGLIPFINNPSYTQTSFSEVVAGTTNITGVQSIGSIGAGKYYYNDSTQTLTFADPLQPGEYIKMLYK